MTFYAEELWRKHTLSYDDFFFVFLNNVNNHRNIKYTKINIFSVIYVFETGILTVTVNS